MYILGTNAFIYWDVSTPKVRYFVIKRYKQAPSNIMHQPAHSGDKASVKLSTEHFISHYQSEEGVY